MMFAKWTFRAAGISGLLILLPQYFLEARNGERYPPAITHPEYYYGFIGVAVAWQVAFLIIARDPVRFRPLMLAAIVEKVSFGVAAMALYLAGRLSTEMVGAGLFDLAFGVAFLIAYLKTGVGPSRRTEQADRSRAGVGPVDLRASTRVSPPTSA